MEHKKQHDAPSGMGRIELFCQHRPPRGSIEEVAGAIQDESRQDKALRALRGVSRYYTKSPCGPCDTKIALIFSFVGNTPEKRKN